MTTAYLFSELLPCFSQAFRNESLRIKGIGISLASHLVSRLPKYHLRMLDEEDNEDNDGPDDESASRPSLFCATSSFASYFAFAKDVITMLVTCASLDRSRGSSGSASQTPRLRRSIALVPPTEALRAGRAKLAKIKAKAVEQARLAAEAKAQARRKLLDTGAPHPADGPEVRLVCAVASNVLAVTLQAGQHANNQLVPYVAQPGDEMVEEDKNNPRHAVKDGRVVDYFQKGLFRKVNNRRTKVGLISPDGQWVFIEHATKGQLLEETVADVPAAYTLVSTDDPNYSQPLAPVKVFRKGKPNGFSQPLPFLYTISLQWPTPFKEGAAYTLRFVGVNTAQETVRYRHQPRLTRSLAIDRPRKQTGL